MSIKTVNQNIYIVGGEGLRGCEENMLQKHFVMHKPWGILLNI